jgi:hypothetical protein
VSEWIASAVATFGQLDGCANVAGIALGEGQITEDIVRKYLPTHDSSGSAD